MSSVSSFDLNKEIIEYVPIILWKNNEDLYNIIKKEFNIVDTFSFTFNENDLKKKWKNYTILIKYLKMTSELNQKILKY